MKYCIVDLKAYDDNDDDCEDVIYAPSVGGELFAFQQSQSTYTWSHRLLFKATNRGDTSKLRKFFYAPAIAQETWGDWVYIGSGDRENPQEDLGSTGAKNRFYAIRNTWAATWDDSSPITDGSTGNTLTDVTADDLQGTESTPSSLTDQQKSDLRTSLSTSGYGWYIDLDRAEKVIASPLIYNKVVYFTTYTPSGDTTASGDPCASGMGSGAGRIYAVDYTTGEAVFKAFNGNSAKLTKEDRYVSLGSGIPSPPTLVVTKEGTFVVVGSEKGVTTINTNDTQFLKRYYWLKQ
jgi:type IV pilus assembly protein PilY1